MTQISLSQLAAHLAKGLRPLYALHGDEALLQQEALDAIRAAARAAGYTERSSFTVAGAHFDWSAVLAAGGSLSLFADKQILEVRIPSGKPGKDGAAALQQLAQAAQGNDSTLTLVILPRLDKAAKTSPWRSGWGWSAAKCLFRTHPWHCRIAPRRRLCRPAKSGQKANPKHCVGP